MTDRDDWEVIRDDNYAMAERLRVLTETARAAADAILSLSDDEAIEDALSSAGHPEAAIEAALRGVLDDHPRPLYGESLLVLVDGPLAGERRRVSGLWGTHVAFSRAGVQYQYNADGTFDRELGEVGGSV